VKVKLIANTELNMDAVDHWFDDDDSDILDDGSDRVYDNRWQMGEYVSHNHATKFTAIPGSDHYEMTFEGERVEYADELAEIAGRLCYKSWSRPNPATGTNQGYLSNIISQAHFSVLEHGSATFWISGVSRSLTHELVRHRHLSFSQVSQRYVDESEGEYVIHPAIRAHDKMDSPFVPEGVIAASMGEHNDVSRGSYQRIVEYLVEQGVDRKTARGAARGVLPNATATELIVTGNHRTWREVLSKRLAPGADAEIQALAAALLVELRKIAPNTYQDFE